MNLHSKQMKNAMFLIAFAILLMWSLENIRTIWEILSRFFQVLTPFLIGFIIAFILNRPMMFFEKFLFGNRSILKNNKKNYKRPISYFITLTVFTLITIVILFIIIPELVNTTQELRKKAPIYWKNILEYVDDNFAKKSNLDKWIREIDFDRVVNNIYTFFKGSIWDWLESTILIASSALSAMITFLLGFVFSIYILLQKEEIICQSKKIILALFPKKIANNIFYIGSLSRETFSNFLTGQFLESIIIGSLFFISMVLFRFPYALMISIVIAITSLIPIIGSFIGCIIGMFIIFVENPKMAFLFLIMFLIIQQIEGNLIYPHVVGKTSGLPSMWILVAVTLGGSLLGIVGILLFIPLFSIIYRLFNDFIDFKLHEKNITRI